MHIRPNQTDPNVQVDALYAAQKAAAKREVERTRKKLLEFASELAGEADSGEDCIVRLDARDEGQTRQNLPRQAKRKKENKAENSEDAKSISDWA